MLQSESLNGRFYDNVSQGTGQPGNWLAASIDETDYRLTWKASQASWEPSIQGWFDARFRNVVIVTAF